MSEDAINTTMDFPSSPSSSEKYDTANSVEFAFSEVSSQMEDAESNISTSPTYKRYPDVVPHFAPFSQSSEADSGDESDLDTTAVFVGDPTYMVTPPGRKNTVVDIESLPSDYVIDVSSISGYLGSRETSFENESSDSMYLTPEKSQIVLSSTPNCAACGSGSGLVLQQADVKDSTLHAKQAVNDRNTSKEYYKMIEQFFIALCESVCVFTFLQAVMVVLKKFDPQLTNIFACLTYKLSFCICIAVVVLMLVGSCVKTMAFVFKMYSSNWIRAGLLLLNIALTMVMFSTFCVIEHYFNSEWFKFKYVIK